MSRVFEEIAKEAAEKAALETTKSLLTLGKLSYEEISKVSKLSVEELRNWTTISQPKVSLGATPPIPCELFHKNH